MFISEAGPLDVRHHAAAEQIVQWFRILEDEFPYVLGAAPFMWNWGPKAGEAQFNYFDKPHIIEAIRNSPKKEFTLPTSWYYGKSEEAMPSWIRNIQGEVPYSTGRMRSDYCGICVHHAGRTTALANLIAYLKSKQSPDANYHFVIGARGETFYLNDIREVVWHAGDGASGPWNQGGVAVCFEGCLTGEGRPTLEQFASFRQLRDWLLAQGVPDVIKPHKGVRVPQWSTQCPGDWWPRDTPVPRELLLEPSELGQLRQRVDELQDEVAQMQADIYSTVELIEAIAEKLGKYS